MVNALIERSPIREQNDHVLIVLERGHSFFQQVDFIATAE